MSDRLTQFFRMSSAFRRETDAFRKKVILEKGMPNLHQTTGSARLKLSISKFIQENSNGDKGYKRAG